MKRLSTSLSRTICKLGSWLNGPMGVRVVLLLLWLLSVVLVSDYTMKQTVAAIDLAELRTLSAAQAACSVAADMEQQKRDQYRKLMSLADRCAIWKPKESF